MRAAGLLACLVTGALLFAGCATATRAERRAAAVQRPCYRLPYRGGTAHLVVQEGPGPLSHTGHQRHAIDFAMDEGTPILAARGGVVLATKADGTQRGLTQDYAKHGNYVRIDHGDGTSALYLHLLTNGVRVGVGQRVAQGDLLGLSGNTGWSMLPHLHFQVDRRDPTTRAWASMPVAFTEVPGDGVPAFLQRYRSANRRATRLTGGTGR